MAGDALEQRRRAGVAIDPDLHSALACCDRGTVAGIGRLPGNDVKMKIKRLVKLPAVL